MIRWLALAAVRPSASLGPGVSSVLSCRSAGRVEPVDPAVPDVEHEAGRGQDDDAGDRRAHAVEARPRPHHLEQLGVDRLQQPHQRGLVERPGGLLDQTLRRDPARHLARGVPAHAVGDQRQHRPGVRAEAGLEALGRRHRRAPDPAPERDRILVAGAHRALMGEDRRAETDRRHVPAAVPAPLRWLPEI